MSIKIHMTSLVLGNSKLFQDDYTILPSYQPGVRVLTSPYSSKHLILSDFLIINVKVIRFKMKSLTTNGSIPPSYINLMWWFLHL